MMDERGTGSKEIEFGKLLQKVDTIGDSIDDIWSSLKSYHCEFHAGLDAMDKRRFDGDEKLNNEIEKIKTEMWIQKLSLGKIIGILIAVQSILLIAIQLWLGGKINV